MAKAEVLVSLPEIPEEYLQKGQKLARGHTFDSEMFYGKMKRPEIDADWIEVCIKEFYPQGAAGVPR